MMELCGEVCLAGRGIVAWYVTTYFGIDVFCAAD